MYKERLYLRFMPAFLYVFFILMVSLSACVSSSKYQSLNTETAQLRMRLDSLKKDQTALLAKSDALDHTREQLRKTENALIQFYMKYEGRIPEQTADSLKTSEIHNTSGDPCEKLQLEFDALQMKWNRFEDSLKTKQNQDRTATAKKEMLAGLEQQNIKLQAENKSLQKKLRDSEAQNEELEKSIQKVQNEHRLSLESQSNLLLNQKIRMQQIDSLLGVIRLSNTTLSDSFRRSSEENIREISNWKDQHTQLLQKIEHLNTLLSQSQEEAQQLRLEANAQKKETADTKQFEEELQIRDRNIMALNDVIEMKNAEIADLKKQASEDGTKQLNLVSQIEQSQKEQERMQTEIQALLIEKSELQERLKNKEQDVSNSKKEAGLREELKSKEQQLSEMKSKYEKLEISFQQANAAVISKSVFTDSLQESQTALNNKLKFIQLQMKENESELERLRTELAEKKEQHADLANRMESLRRTHEQLQQKLKLSNSHVSPNQNATSNTLSDALLSKLEKIKSSAKGMEYFVEKDHSKSFFYINQKSLFQEESLVMKQEGTNTISDLAAACKLDKNVKIHISAFLKPGTTNKITTDQLIRHAGTVYKLMNALGIQADQMTLGAKQIPTKGDRIDFIQGIELMIYAD